MTGAVVLELAIVSVALGTGAASTLVALRAQARARAGRLALRLAHAREAAFVEAARGLAAAARSSVDAVRDELVRAAQIAAPAIDAVSFYEEHDGELVCVHAAGERMSYFTGSRLARDDASALPARALRAGHRITLADGVRPLHPLDAAALAVPLALDAGRACVLVLSTRAALDGESCERLVTLAEHASPAYAIAADREDDRRRAEFDGLTGLFTPRAFRQRLAAMTDRARVMPSARLALLFIDTDRFKQWNDSYGHACGDALLRELAQVLRAAARGEHDLVARNGGDEFCLVFGESGKADAIERAEALRRRIAAIDVTAFRPAGARADVRISASIGVAAFPADATSASELLERADAAMYHSKREGRDAVSYIGVDGAFARL
jgi:diguanylate cyclase (GGDEF)-like protein